MTRERTPERLAKIRRVLAKRQQDLTLVLANIYDPHNVSAIYRSCDAFGIAQVFLYYTTEPFPVLGKKSSASARKWVESVRCPDLPTLSSGLTQTLGPEHQILLTNFTPSAKPITEFDFTRPTAVVFGNEHRGVDPELAGIVTHEMYIPMQGMVQSLNVSVAAAVTLFEAWRQRRAAGMLDEPSFSADKLEAMYEEWSKM